MSERTAPVVDTLSEASHNSEDRTNQTSLIEFLCSSLSVLWKEWPKHMKCTVLENDKNKFSLVGICPHCKRDSVFIVVAGPHTEPIDHHRYRFQYCAAMRCQGCLNFILALVGVRSDNALEYVEHYPLGKPDDSIDKHIKEPMASNFREAIRCLWVDAHKATVAMCRRAVEASCNDLGAKGKNLKRKINNLAERRLITESLQQMAHAVRITANEQLHGKKQSAEQDQEAIDASTIEIVTSDLDTFSKEDAEAIVEFTGQFFQHVYVMPERLKKYLKPEGETPADAS